MKTHVRDRIARNRELAIADSKARCTFCRRPLPHVGVLLMLTPSGASLKYCNENCRQDHVDARQTMEAHR